jgi:osmotically-inducible protein OsmY
MVQSKKTDAQIQRDVIDELGWDTRVKATDIGVEVQDGIVTLSGTVDSWTERVGAQEAAHRVAGVLDVANEVRIQLPGEFQRHDTDIARAVRQALEWDVTIPHERIRTTVSNGVVTLEGNVDLWAERDGAERCVRNLTGVVEVRNLVSIDPFVPEVSAHTLHQAIGAALERKAERAARAVHIAVKDGNVTLTGEASSWIERSAIEQAVRGTRGVRKVDNQIRV